jgi:hypothetical protein
MAVEQSWPPVGVISAAALNGSLGSLLVLVDSADSAPTAQAASAFATYRRLLDQELAKWAALKKNDIPGLNRLLGDRQMSQINIGN